MKTFALLAAMTGLFLAVGFLVGGAAGAAIAFVVAAAMNGFAYWNADKFVLRMQGARPVGEGEESPVLRAFVGDVHAMADGAGLPRPAVYIIDTAQPNAFATGRDYDNAAVAATTGLLNLLTRDEVKGVMAHELAHIKNRDSMIMTVTATLAGAVGMLANFALFFTNRERGGMLAGLAIMILAPVAAGLVQMAISRSREYEADRGGAEICGNPLWLASALAKIERGARVHVNRKAESAPAMAHMYIIHPLAGGGRDRLFSTHPDTGNRIAALEELAREMGVGSREPSRRPANDDWRVPGRKRQRGPWDRPQGPWG